jgi:predicted PurR-regulated permease PerM
MKKTINISTSTIIRFFVVLLAIGLLYLLRDIVLVVFAALVLAVAVDRPIDALERKGVPRVLSVTFIYLLLFAAVAFLIYLIFPVLAMQIKNLLTNYSFYLKKIGQLQPKTTLFNIRDLVDQFADKLTASASTVFGTLASFFGGVISFFTVLLLAIFFSAQEDGVRKFVFYLAPEEHQQYTLIVFDKIQQRVGGWLWGRIILSIALGLLVGVGLYFLKIKYALLLGCMAALLSFIPIVGPVISAVPAVLLGLSKTAVLGLSVTLLYLFIFTIVENFVLIPILMKKAVDLNPALIVLVLLIGAKVAGTTGAILSIPAAAVIAVLVEEYIGRRESRGNGKMPEVSA